MRKKPGEDTWTAGEALSRGVITRKVYDALAQGPKWLRLVFWDQTPYFMRGREAIELGYIHGDGLPPPGAPVGHGVSYRYVPVRLDTKAEGPGEPKKPKPGVRSVYVVVREDLAAGLVLEPTPKGAKSGRTGPTGRGPKG